MSNFEDIAHIPRQEGIMPAAEPERFSIPSIEELQARVGRRIAQQRSPELPDPMAEEIMRLAGFAANESVPGN
jgi:hypothetical protein